MLCRLLGSESMSQSGLLDGEGPTAVIAVPQPAWADTDMHDVGIIGTFLAVGVLGKVFLHTAIVVGAGGNVGGHIALQRHPRATLDPHPKLSQATYIAAPTRSPTSKADPYASRTRAPAI